MGEYPHACARTHAHKKASSGFHPFLAACLSGMKWVKWVHLPHQMMRQALDLVKTHKNKGERKANKCHTGERIIYDQLSFMSAGTTDSKSRELTI